MTKGLTYVVMAFCFALSLCEAFGQRFEYGFSFHINSSQINSTSKDSFNSNASWGASCFFEKPISKNWAISIEPGFNQLSYISEIGLIQYKSRNFDNAVKCYYAPSKLKHMRLSAGMIPGFQFSKLKLEPTGSNASGLKTEIIELNKGNFGLGLGVDMQIAKGLNIEMGYQYFLSSTYYADRIVGRPSQFKASFQFRFNEFAQKEMPLTNKIVELNAFQTLYVLLPSSKKDLPFKAGEIATIGHYDSLFYQIFKEEYTYSKVVFVRDSMIEKLPNLGSEALLYTMPKAQEATGSESWAMLKIGNYFTEGGKSETSGMFLLNANSELIKKPFEGFYRLSFFHSISEETLVLNLRNAVIKLNKDLLSK